MSPSLSRQGRGPGPGSLGYSAAMSADAGVSSCSEIAACGYHYGSTFRRKSALELKATGGEEIVREKSQRKRFWLSLALAVASSGALSVSFPQSAIAQTTQARVTAATDERILPSDVTMDNHEAFQEQMRRDLPLGTAKADVEAYLTRWRIPYDFFGPNYGALGNSFHAVVEDLGMYHGYTPRLSAWIYLDDANLVREIRFHLRVF